MSSTEGNLMVQEIFNNIPACVVDAEEFSQGGGGPWILTAAFGFGFGRLQMDCVARLADRPNEVVGCSGRNAEGVGTRDM